MLRIELSVCLDLYLELALTPKMTLLRSETGTLKFVPISEELPNSLDSNSRTNPDKEESENPYPINKKESSLPSSLKSKAPPSSLKTKALPSSLKTKVPPSSLKTKAPPSSLKTKTLPSPLKSEAIESDDKIEYSPNPHSIENCTSKSLEKLNEMMNRRLSTEKPLSIKSLIPTEEHRCDICKKTFKSRSGEYKHVFQCRKSLENLLNNIKPLESILKPGTEVGRGITDPIGNASHLKNDSLLCDKQDKDDSWTLATRTAAGTVDNPSYYFVKKFALPKDLFNSLHTDRRNNSEQEGSSSDISPHTGSSVNVDCTKINKPPVLPSTVDKEKTLNHTCENCKLSYKTSGGLYLHKLKCTKPLQLKIFKPTEAHTCKICKISFKTRLGLYKHGPKCAKPIKISNKNRICPKCNKSFKSYSGIYRHLSKCGRPKKVGKKLRTVETDLLNEFPELYSPTEIGQIIYRSDNLSTSLMNDDSLNSDDKVRSWFDNSYNDNSRNYR